MTVFDLEFQPDNGNRYELIDGQLYVTPPPPFLHQEVVAQLAYRLNQAKTEDMAVFVAPLPVRFNSAVEVQPDIVVAPADEFVDGILPGPPEIAVEVLSLSSVVSDFNIKKRTYEKFDVPQYWVIDPVEPRMVIFNLDKRGKYRDGREVAGSRPFRTAQPFQIRFTPMDLLSGLGLRQTEAGLVMP